MGNQQPAQPPEPRPLRTFRDVEWRQPEQTATPQDRRIELTDAAKALDEVLAKAGIPRPMRRFSDLVWKK